MIPKCTQQKGVYIFDYPEVSEWADAQNSIFWPWDEIDLEKDLQDLRTNLTPAEYHGVITTLKLFVKYELIAGGEYWSERFKNMFPRPEFQKLAACFAYFELNVHAPFYNKINEILNINTEEFYSSYVNDPVLVDRLEFIDSSVNDEDDLFSLAVFSMVEGAVLYSSFAFLKHFQAEGKNKLSNLIAGIDFSVRDENLHSEAGAKIFRLLKSESDLTATEEDLLKSNILEAADKIRMHEHRIAEMVFSEGSMEGITETQMKHFIDSRIDLCLENLGYSKIYKPKYNPIAKWFYKNINGPQLHDFFHRQGKEYHRNWDKRRFIWRQSEIE